ncbi:hypothetical protein JCM4814A_79180 [Streptomyces phaeofaciens JCM 4814]|uniref:Uncharacterized protein n=1 Tax=Streptomyces phaeofaciens TaxID=68254 RepID=A0A918M194_9ACTN|nr:hypothetical protein [Streptomyces phaeofaciens]GGT92810.1 hypothetical protein GCM10010226_83460 [Streptomyces phaeofaciens]
MTPDSTPDDFPFIVPFIVPGRCTGDLPRLAHATSDGIHLQDRRAEHRPLKPVVVTRSMERNSRNPGDLVQALLIRTVVHGWTPAVKDWPTPTPAERDSVVDHAAKAFMLCRSERWREAVSTALVGSWCDPLWQTGQLPHSALGALRAEARSVHRQLVPVWRRRTRAGRVLSLDADLGGLSLHDLVAADVDLLAHTQGGVFADERLNAVLRGLDPAERTVVFAYAESEGTTWTEAATYAGAVEPKSFGERVRRKVKRLVAEQRRRAEQRHPGPPMS